MNAADVARRTLAQIPFRVDLSVMRARRTADLADELLGELAKMPTTQHGMIIFKELLESAKDSRHATSAAGQMYLHLAYFIREDEPVDGS